ncbi:OLC1v1004756C1, partial [Oldenlandia corymbosa var. corymbosa]
LEGSLPACLGNLSSLNELRLGSNKLGGELPSELGNLMQLTELDLSHNFFMCPIPSSFGQLTMMERLTLNDNHLNGPIPQSLMNLTELRNFDVSYNSLSGELSESDLGGLKSLQFLDISRNQFLVLKESPQWIPPFPLVDLRMDSVFIGTRFLPWLQNEKNVIGIVLTNTSISGTIPDWCGTSFPNLNYFDLSKNFLTGPVPAFDVNYSTYPWFQVLTLANN